MLEQKFDYVLVAGEGLYTFEQFQTLSLRDQAKIVLNNQAQFFCEGDPIPKKDALGNKVEPVNSENLN